MGFISGEGPHQGVEISRLMIVFARAFGMFVHSQTSYHFKRALHLISGQGTRISFEQSVRTVSRLYPMIYVIFHPLQALFRMENTRMHELVRFGQRLSGTYLLPSHERFNVIIISIDNRGIYLIVGWIVPGRVQQKSRILITALILLRRKVAEHLLCQFIIFICPLLIVLQRRQFQQS